MVREAHVSVTPDGIWRVESPNRKVTLDGRTLGMVVEAGTTKWEMPPDGLDVTVEAAGETLRLSFSQAGKIEISPYGTGHKAGVMAVVGGFRHNGAPLDFSLRLFVCLEGGTEELLCEAVAAEGAAKIKELRWPKGVAPATVNLSVVPFMQGMLLPRDWPKELRFPDAMSYGRVLYMPWWGQQQGAAAALTILETPADAGCDLEHPAGGPTSLAPRWIHSLGALRYPRRVRLCFFERGNYADLAKRYRRHVVETGRFVSLREKIAGRPVVGALVGTPVLHTGIYAHVVPESRMYRKDQPEANDTLSSFDERADALRELHRRGLRRAYVHLDGWGQRGYDNLHPDILPPCPQAGGWEGLRRLADTCDELGYVLALHDQYRDYYHDASSYQERHTLLDEHGARPFANHWHGGNHSFLCPSLAYGHVARNYRALLERGIKIKGAYLDVFAVVTPDECYNPEHPVTRRECLQYRAECLGLVRATLGVASSEEPADWAIPHLDIVHHGPYALDRAPEGNVPQGIPAPLFNLVYHDAVVLPWLAFQEKGHHELGWGPGVPDSDSSLLHCLLNAGVPYLPLRPTAEDLRAAATACALHRRVGLLEMTSHAFLDGTGRRQRSAFADGTTVTVDFDTGAYEVSPALVDVQSHYGT